MSPKAAMMGANTKREGRSGGGALKAGSLAVGSDSAAKRGVKHHHRPAPRLRFVPPKEKNRPLMRGGLCWTSPSLIRAFVGRFRYGEEQGAYSPQCVEGVFSEVRPTGVLGSSEAGSGQREGEALKPPPSME